MKSIDTELKPDIFNSLAPNSGISRDVNDLVSRNFSELTRVLDINAPLKYHFMHQQSTQRLWQFFQWILYTDSSCKLMDSFHHLLTYIHLLLYSRKHQGLRSIHKELQVFSLVNTSFTFYSCEPQRQHKTSRLLPLPRPHMPNSKYVSALLFDLQPFSCFHDCSNVNALMISSSFKAAG